LSIFTTDVPLPRILSPKEWRSLIINRINRHFEDKEYLLSKRRGRSTIYRPKPRRIAELEAYEGISFALYITPEWKPLLTCNIDYRYHIDKVFADRRAIDDYTLEKPEVLSEKHGFETRDTDSQFGLIQRFIRALPVIPQTDSLSFKDEPVTSEKPF